MALDSAGGIPVVRAALDAAAGGDAWPLARDAAARVGDALGGRLVLVADGAVAVEPACGDELPSIANLLDAVEAVERPIHAIELVTGDELLTIGLPLGVVAIGAVDGARLTGAPGPVTRRLARAWREAAGPALALQQEARHG